MQYIITQPPHFVHGCGTPFLPSFQQKSCLTAFPFLGVGTPLQTNQKSAAALLAECGGA